MSPRSSLYAAFLYGVNIPGGRRLSKEDVSSALERLQPATTFAATVGRPDSVVLWSNEPSTEESVRKAVSGALGCACVVLSAATLEGIADAALDAARKELRSDIAPYRITHEGVEWEMCVVLSCDPLPTDAIGDGWLFRPTASAVAVAVLGRRALLARKRRLTPAGKRVMLGAALNKPWKGTLESKGLAVECLTSRTLNRLVEVVAKTRTLKRV